MTILNLRNLAALLVFSSAFSANAQTETTSPANTDQSSWFPSISTLYNSAVTTTENLYDNGRVSIILSGYTWHDPRTYSPAKRATLNADAWGFGVSKELRDAKDNEESIQILAISDSHFKPQINASYTYQWMKPIGGNWEIGAGVNAGLVSRTDIFNSIPFPGILPMFSVGTHDTKVTMTYVPHLSGSVNGNVLYFNLRVAVK